MESANEKQRVTFDTARKAAHEQVFDEAFLVAIGITVKDSFTAKPCCSVS
ncbi:unnamed protein product [Nippostrongylus brasiliensis]|uniref:Transposase n=1 Tax=Nippostrongylus brasiliensis TaxID=27835 RepID=A0A0N4YGE5_NIPBR|nr:unnamed protein product [Nippostrongylus brasiliensis]